MWSSLQHLNLAFNSIHRLTSRSFEGIPNLLYLNLKHNRIRKFFVRPFRGLTSLRTLILSHNKISKLHNLVISYNASNRRKQGCSGDLQNLRFIDLSYNRISEVGNLPFLGMCRLEIIHLHHNRLHFIPDGFLWDLNSLRSVNIDFNQMRNLSRAWLFINQNVPLQNLSLAHNQISMILNNAFMHTNKLQFM